MRQKSRKRQKSRRQKKPNFSGPKKKSCNLLVQQKITQPLGGKNVLKIQILVTIKIQEIGTDHLGLVSGLN
jgi:hypothetical protein